MRCVFVGPCRPAHSRIVTVDLVCWCVATLGVSASAVVAQCCFNVRLLQQTQPPRQRVLL
jgi:hypothetical protein